MRTISEIYKHYRLPSNLQAHQLRVAAVAQYICNHCTVEVNTEKVTQAALLHDMGNIIKFNLGYFPEALEPEGLEYWQQVQNDYKHAYGLDEHAASIAIAKELGVTDDVIDYIDHVDFPLLEKNAQSNCWEKKICAYADLRVAPAGIVSIQERLEDGYNRYKDRPEKAIPSDSYHVLIQSLHRIERQLQEVSTIDLSTISEDVLAGNIEALKSFTI